MGNDHTSDGFPTTDPYAEPTLWWYCQCGAEKMMTLATFTGNLAVGRCHACHRRQVVMRADCTTERRTPAVEVVEANLRMCDACQGRGQVYVSDDHNGIEICAICDGAGQIPYPTALPHDSGATVSGTGEFPAETRGDYATAPVYKCNSKECGGLSLESGLFEGLCACGASVTEVRDVSKDQYRRMCAQADEIRKLKGTLRIAEEQIANLEREHAARALERDEARAEVERLNKEADSLAQQRKHWQLRFGEACDERNEATSRIAKLEEAVLLYEQAVSSSLNLTRTFVLARTACLEAGLSFVEGTGGHG